MKQKGMHRNMHLEPKCNFDFSRKGVKNDFFPNLLGQLRSMGLRGSCGKISKFRDLKSRPKWYMEGAWGIIINKSLWISRFISI